MAGKVIILAKKDTKPLDERLVEKARKRLEWMVGFMIVRYHFVYHILSMMTKVPNQNIPTMGVRVLSGGNFELVYNPEFVNELTDAQLTYVFYHEILHLALHHCTFRKFDDRDLGNIATDLAVNELIPEIPNSCEIKRDKSGKPEWLLVSEFKKEKIYSDIQHKQTSEWYYDYLRRKQKENKDKSASGKIDKHFDDHSGWNVDELADEKVRAKIDEIAKSNLWGSMSETDKELIISAQTRRVNWRNLLRRFYGNVSIHENEATRKRPNRRTGIQHPGNRRVQVDRHLVAVDTSGSIDSELLSMFLGTINQMKDYVPIDMMQFDCEKTSDPRPFDQRRTSLEFLGRGGTNFDPVMKVVEERRYKSVVILTDGVAGAPTQPNAKVIWCMPEGCNPPVDWGMKVFLNKYA